MAQVITEKMTAAEFFQMPEETAFVELIDGEITMSPSPITSHQEIVGRIYLMLQSMIREGRIGGRVLLSPLDVHLDEYNVVEPDVFWVSGEGSLCQPSEDGYWHGAPDLAVEVISAGSVSRDRVKKLRLYEKHGVREYWIADPAGEYMEVWQRQAERLAHVGTFTAEESFTSTALGDQAITLQSIWQ
jgi:Uma2 family endonuclease